MVLLMMDEQKLRSSVKAKEVVERLSELYFLGGVAVLTTNVKATKKNSFSFNFGIDYNLLVFSDNNFL